MSKSKDIEDKKFVMDMRADKSKNYISQIRRNYPNILQKIVDFNESVGLELSSERELPRMIYHWVEDIGEIPICPLSGLPLKFTPSNWKYNKFGKQGINYRDVKQKSAKNALKIFNIGTYHSNLIEKSNKVQIGVDELQVLLRDFHKSCKTFTTTLLSFRFKYPEYYKYIEEDIYPECENMTEKMYCIHEGILPKKCKYDNNLKAKFTSFNDGYKRYNSKNLKEYKREQILIKLSSYIENDDIYSTEETSRLIQKYIEDFKNAGRKCNNLYTIFLKHDPKLIASISHHTRKMLNVKYSQRIHYMVHGDPVIDKPHIKPRFFSYEVGYIMGYENPQESKGEKELFDWLSSYTNVYKDRSILKGKELDIVCSDYNLAIEYDGEYWHNSEIVGEKGLLWKTEECEKNGLKLIHVLETEWDDHKDKIKSMILSKINKYDRKIYARKCEVRAVGIIEFLTFQRDNYLGDFGGSGNFLGLYFNDELVSSLKYSENGGAVFLDCFCNKLYTQVIGGFGKIFKHLKKIFPKHSFRCVVDRRFSDGEFLTKFGFNVTEVLPPIEWFFQGGSKRMDTGRLLTPSKEVFKNSKSKLLSIHDCGNLIFEYHPAK